LRYLARFTVNLCAIDLSKAFDKVNHHALFMKLMKRNIPVQLLHIVENLFNGCLTRIKWFDSWSAEFMIQFGVRQGSVLSPFLFAILVDDIAALDNVSVNSMSYYMLMISCFSHPLLLAWKNCCTHANVSSSGWICQSILRSLAVCA